MWINLNPQQLRILSARCPEIETKVGRDEVDEQFFQAACLESDDDLEFDPDAVVSRSDEGAYVMGWYWVSNDAAGLVGDDDEEDDE